MMTIYPCSKINLGLNIIGKRNDGYHNLETVLYPIPLCDQLELIDIGHQSENPLCTLEVDGALLDCDPQHNLVVKAYELIAKEHGLPDIRVKLTKKIPSEAGLGGGSSDAVNMLKLLNEYFSLNISSPKMQDYAVQLGADCSFFIHNKPCFASGIGEKMEFLNTEDINLSRYYIGLVKPEISISTKEAFSNIKPRPSTVSCKDIVKCPIKDWRYSLVNDFEHSIFKSHPSLGRIKEELYNMGALYAQMSGSGSTIFGFFSNEPHSMMQSFRDSFTFITKL